MYFIGIDSGLSGAISVLDKNGDLYDLIKVPLEKIEEITEIFASYLPKRIHQLIKENLHRST